MRPTPRVLGIGPWARRLGRPISWAIGATAAVAAPVPGGDPGAAAADYARRAEPILAKYCYDCHGNGVGKGGVTFDEFESAADVLRPRDQWWAALRNVRAGIMPPQEEDVPRPTAAEIDTLADWIKHGAFGLERANPDPGPPILRRLNRVEYRNTIRDLLGIDFNSEVEFPPDDSGHGFDNNAEVLTLSPLLLEKYLVAAETIMARVLAETADRASGAAGPPRAARSADGRIGEARPEGSPIHARYFATGAAPEESAARDRFAAGILRDFAGRAYRRPVEEAQVQRLVGLARATYGEPGHSFAQGIAQAMMAVLASPRFLFRLEAPAAAPPPGGFALVDEYALASRLSYFLWSTMPDEGLLQLAERGGLRRELGAQVRRMLADSRAREFVRHFTGQWLQARDIEFVPLNARIIGGDNVPRNRDGRPDFDGVTRRLLRSETEAFFEHVLREDRSVLELIDADYTFLNERLAALYGIPGVSGTDLRRVTLPVDSPRGGVLTQGTVLAVTSNPTRTSPVKRGLFILENILGTPPPPPPPDVPELEDVRRQFQGREPKLGEMLALHRQNKLCHSCHARMDPLGLALENFNALGLWRETEAGQPIETAGRLITGENFSGIRDLKRVLARERTLDVYRCLTEKLLAYAVGRGTDYYDTVTIDAIVERLVAADGRLSALVFGVIESATFQKVRVPPAAATGTSTY